MQYLIAQLSILNIAGPVIPIAGAPIMTKASISHILINVKNYSISVATMITNEFPDINVVGNKAPAHLTPLTGYDNKFYNSKTKKYINFPAIGAFEVVFCGQTIFSKKKTNAWP